MELRHLQYFVAVAEELHFTRAADRLRVAQPPLSQQIKRLEQELDTRLLERNRKGIARLTDAGEVFLREAYEILERADRAAHLARSASSGEVGHLTIGCIPAGFVGILQPIIRVFHEKYPNVSLSLRELSTNVQLEELNQGTLDLAFVRDMAPRPGIDTLPLLDESLVLATSERSDLAKAESVKVEQLSEYPFVILGHHVGAHYYLKVLEVCRTAGFSPKIVQECDSIITELGMVACELGVALVPNTISRLSIPGIVYRKLSEPDPETFQLQVSWNSHRPSQVRDNFIETVHQNL